MYGSAAAGMRASMQKVRRPTHCPCSFVPPAGHCPALQFEVPYDVLVYAVGEQPATFGVKGVEEYAYFMKEVGTFPYVIPDRRVM